MSSDVVKDIVKNYELLSPLRDTQNRMIRKFVEGGDAKILKEYTFRSMYDYVEVRVLDKPTQAFNVDGDLIEGRFIAYDSAIGSTRLFENWDDAECFARMRVGSQKYLNGVMGK